MVPLLFVYDRTFVAPATKEFVVPSPNVPSNQTLYCCAGARKGARRKFSLFPSSGTTESCSVSSTCPCCSFPDTSSVSCESFLSWSCTSSSELSVVASRAGPSEGSVSANEKTGSAMFPTTSVIVTNTISFITYEIKWVFFISPLLNDSILPHIKTLFMFSIGYPPTANALLTFLGLFTYF